MKFLKEGLEHKKRVYETYIQVLVKYNIKNVAYSAIMAEEYFQKELMMKLDKCRKDKKSFMGWLFGEKCSEEERINKDIEYFDKLIKIVQNKIEMMDDKIKIKIAKDAVEKQEAWFKLIGDDNGKKR